MSACNSCHAPVIWAETRTGKRMPVDTRPHPDGNVRIVAHPSGVQMAEVLGPLEVAAAEQPLHRSHFATCPNAAQHRRGGRS